jgi:hypothetical protein
MVDVGIFDNASETLMRIYDLFKPILLIIASMMQKCE